MDNEKEKDLALSFGVDLSKTEYIVFQKTVSQFTSGSHISRFITVGLAVFLLLMTVNIVKNDVSLLWDPNILSLLLFFVLLLAGWTLLPQITQNRRAAKGYEDALAGGQVFEGMVTVNADGITKVTESGSLTLSFDRDLLCIERKEMFIFINRLGQGIVLPARCMTAKDATAVSTVVKMALPPRFYIVKGKITPQRTERMVFSEQVTAPKTVYTVDVLYNDSERKALMKTVIKRDIFRTAPLAVLFSFLLSVSIGMDRGFAFAAIVFWIAIGLFAGMKALFWVPRYKGSAAAQDARLTVLFTERAVVMEKRVAPGVQRLVLQWKDIRHAVEDEDAVEIYNSKQYLYIPKRCVGDMDFLRSVVNDKMKRSARERNKKDG